MLLPIMFFFFFLNCIMFDLDLLLALLPSNASALICCNGLGVSELNG